MNYKQLKIYLIDKRLTIYESWERSFSEALGFHENIEIINTDFHNFMKMHPEVQGIVSPANSYGLMDGGYDLAIAQWFGSETVTAVQNKIKDIYYGEQPVASCLCVPVPNHIASNKFILHTPTMRVPSIIQEPEVVYHCTRSCVIEALRNNLTSVVIPAFGGCCGEVKDTLIADYMERAFYSFENTPNELTWHWAYRCSSLGEYNPKEVTYD